MNPRLDLSPRDRLLQLSDGRALGYCEFGAADGFPVFYFHGLPGSRLEARLTHRAARAHGLRVVAVDRPGFGRSAFQPRRRIADWPGDVDRLADHLGLARFGVLGVSGGGPYAVACAAALHGRVDRVAVVCGMGPLQRAGVAGMAWPNRTALRLAQRLPWLADGLMALVALAGRRNPERLLVSLAPYLSQPDQAVLGRGGSVRTTIAASVGEAFRAGSRGPGWDLGLLTRPWEVPLEAIRCPVHLWHGEADTSVPPAMTHLLGRRIATAQTRLLPGEGHYSVPLRHMGGILAALAAEPERRGDKAAGDG